MKTVVSNTIRGSQMYPVDVVRAIQEPPTNLPIVMG
jgi:hypothetical protein